jgi:membrane associated rhomboid family serine protease
MNRNIKKRVSIIASLVALFWIIELIDIATGNDLGIYGILPRTVIGLRGIIFAPFLHQNIYHLLLNTIPFIVLGSLVSLRGVDDFLEVSLFVMLVGGAGVWLVGRPAYHIGASGLIFGYFGFLATAGWYERRFSSIFISLVVLFLYGGLLQGVLPVRPFVSWEGHLCGLLAGAACARLSTLR